MIYVVVGTKAQLVKMAPLMARLQDQKIPYRFIFTGQHQETMGALRENFNVKPPDMTLYHGKDITSIGSMFFWILRILWQTVTKRREIFPEAKGIVLVHGDTFSTLLGALMGRLSGLQVGHVESGLRSFNIFHPFPEELTRLITFWLSDVYYCPGVWAVENLKKFSGTKINTQFNTLLDALRHVRSKFQEATVKLPSYTYGVVTMHRFENLFSKDTLERNLELIEQVARRTKVIFILHPITKRKLEHFGFLTRLEENPHIETRPRYDYLNFMKLVDASEFLITDGGSNQEECFYIGKPCLLLRKATERQEGLGKNTVISAYKMDVVIDFAEGYKRFRGPDLLNDVSPCQIITDHAKGYR